MVIKILNGRGWKIISSTNENDITYVGEYGISKNGNEGVIYKDYTAFKNKKGVCYIPEFIFMNSEQNSNELFEFEAKEKHASKIENNSYIATTGYTYQEFLSLANGDEKFAKEIFDAVDWQDPLTYLNELEDE